MEAKEAERVISDEVANIEPQFEDGDFKAFKAWSKQTAMLKSFKIKTVEQPRLGQEVPSKVTAEAILDLKDLPTALR